MKHYIFASLISFIFYLFQGATSIDFQSIADKYGVPVAFSLVMFFYFSAQAKRAEKNASEDRGQILESNAKQVEILQKVLAQNIIGNNNLCKFNEHNKIDNTGKY